MICTRLDLAYPMNHVSQFVSNLGNGHWLAIKWIFWYFQTPKGFGLKYGELVKIIQQITNTILSWCDVD
jgi:hypothetical protein